MQASKRTKSAQTFGLNNPGVYSAIDVGTMSAKPAARGRKYDAVIGPLAADASCSDEAITTSKAIGCMSDSTQNGTPGDYGIGFPNFIGKVDDPEAKQSKLAAELANGRLAMVAIIGMLFHGARQPGPSPHRESLVASRRIASTVTPATMVPFLRVREAFRRVASQPVCLQTNLTTR